jgi:hypothetical protein
MRGTAKALDRSNDGRVSERNYAHAARLVERKEGLYTRLILSLPLWGRIIKWKE